MPSLNNYNTRSQMALDIPLCRTIKGQKSMLFLRLKIWNKISLNIKTATTTSSFTHRLKKEILSKLQERIILLIYYYYYDYYFFFNFLKVDFFYYISLCSYLQRDPNRNKNRSGSFLGNTCHLRSTSKDKIFEKNSSFHVKQRTTGKLQFLFSRRLLLVLTKFSFWEENWPLGYTSIKF